MKKNKLNEIKKQLSKQVSNDETQELDVATADADNNEKFTSKDWIALGVSVIFLGLLAFLSLQYFNGDGINVSGKIKDLQNSIANTVDSQRGETSSTSTSAIEENDTNTNDNKPEQGMTSENASMQSTEDTWQATDYKQGDIQKGTYEVKSGDTLWEIAEAVYGNGAQWTQILQANAQSIGTLPSGQQALIIPGQVLTIN